MDIINKIVLHKKWGCGKIIKLNVNSTGNDGIEVLFDDFSKPFQYPEAFSGFLKFEDEKYQKYVEELIAKKEAERELKRLEQERIAQLRVEQQHQKEKKPKNVPKANVAFKCNFCDGGCSDTCIGFKGVCSDEIIDYNIEVANHTWCTDKNSACFQYHNGEITREELDEQCSNGGFVCYESIMLNEWKARAGLYTKGEHKGEAMKLKQVQVNSLAILTTRHPNSPEQDRFVFGVFLVDDAYEGDNKEEGYATTSSKYKIELSPEEAVKIKYWNYYFNSNSKDNISWSSGLHRYIDDIHAAQILRDIAKLKEKSKDEELSKEFYEHFCKINGLDSTDIPEPDGALINL